MSNAGARWLKTDGPRGIDRYIDYFGDAVAPFVSRAGAAPALLESHSGCASPAISDPDATRWHGSGRCDSSAWKPS